MTEDVKNSGAQGGTEEISDRADPPEAGDAPGESATGEDEGSEEPSPPVDPLEAARAEAAQMKDKLIRMAADFDNFRKRSRREIEDASKKGRDSLLNDLLPVFDNLERATAHAETTGTHDAAGVKGLVDGIGLVLRQFHDALGRLGIERVVSLGQPFDPSLHEAIQHLETSEYRPGCVAAEVQPGYRQGDRLVRPAMVVVAKAPANPEPMTKDEDLVIDEEVTDEAPPGAHSQSNGGESPGA